MSYMNPLHCAAEERNALLRARKDMGGNERELKRDRGDDISTRKGFTVGCGNITEIDWFKAGLEARISPALYELRQLKKLWLYGNDLVGTVPSWLGEKDKPLAVLSE